MVSPLVNNGEKTLARVIGKRIQNVFNKGVKSTAFPEYPRLSADEFIRKSKPLSVEKFLTTFKKNSAKLERLDATVEVKRNIFGKKSMTIRYGGNVKVKVPYYSRNLDLALQLGKEYSQLSKALPEGSKVTSHKFLDRYQLILKYPNRNRKPAKFTDIDYDLGLEACFRKPEPTRRFEEIQKHLKQFKANLG